MADWLSKVIEPNRYVESSRPKPRYIETAQPTTKTYVEALSRTESASTFPLSLSGSLPSSGPTASGLGWAEIRQQIACWNLSQDFWDTYQVVGSPLGQGNFGQVLKIQARFSPANVYALKMFSVKPSSDTEIQVLMQIKQQCPGHGFPSFQGLFIVPELASDRESAPRYALMMDMVQGVPSNELLYQEEDVLEIAQQVLQQLACLHSKGLVHGDVKPTNILVDSGPPLRAVLIDYGASCTVDSLANNKFDNINACSRISKGDFYFWSPEINLLDKSLLEAETANFSSDIWALGFSLWVLVHPDHFQSLDTEASGQLVKQRSDLLQTILAAPDSQLNRLIKQMIQPQIKRPSAAELLSQT